MSFIDLLFPVGELEALGNKWPEPPSKRRRIELNAGLAQGQPRRQTMDASLNQRRHTLSTPSSQSKRTSLSNKPVNSTVKRSYSESKPTTTSTTSMSYPNPSSTPKSCLPNFIEPSLLKNYLHHLHPNDRSRYSIPNSPEAEAHQPSSEQTRRAAMHHDSDESACSPASLTTDTSSTYEADRCPTPSAGIYDQLRAGPFGYLMDGLRVTEHERNLMEDLLGPGQPGVAKTGTSSNPKRDATSAEITNPNAEDFYNFDQQFLQKMFPTHDNSLNPYFGHGLGGYAESDVHSSGLSPAREEEEEQQEVEIENQKETIIRGIAISVDDFFDLDEASGTTVPVTE